MVKLSFHSQPPRGIAIIPCRPRLGGRLSGVYVYGVVVCGGCFVVVPFIRTYSRGSTLVMEVMSIGCR